MFFCVFFEKSIISRFRFQVYTRLNYLKFEIPKIFWGGAHRAPSPDPSPRSFSGFALDSGFALKSRALRALDSGFARFGPPNFWSVAAPLMALQVHCGLGQLSPLPTSGDDKWVAAKHRGRAKRSRISDTHRLRPSLQFRYINDQSLLFLISIVGDQLYVYCCSITLWNL